MFNEGRKRMFESSPGACLRALEQHGKEDIARGR